MPVILKTIDLCREYERNHKFFAVENTNLSINEGEFITIQGTSGSGKSTLLSMLAGLLKPTKGQIFLDEKDISKLTDKALSKIRRTITGYIPQGHSLLGNLTVRENIVLPLEFAKNEYDEFFILDLLKQFKLDKLAGSYPASLSGGERRRCAIVRALAIKPKIILADEPTNDLDKDSRNSVLEMFKQISNAGTAILLVSHEDYCQRFADTAYSMEKGVLTKL